MSKLSKAIWKTTGLTVKDFCEQELKTRYPAFAARMKGNKMYAAEVYYIINRTGHTCEYLFDRSLQEMIITATGNVSPEVVTAVNTADLKILKPEKLPAPPPPEKKPEGLDDFFVDI